MAASNLHFPRVRSSPEAATWLFPPIRKLWQGWLVLPTRWDHLLALVLVLFGSGFYSEPWMELVDKSLQGLSSLYHHH